MQGNPAVHRLVAPVANRFFGKADREASGVLSAAQRHTDFLDSPRIADCVAMSDFRFADLREGRLRSPCAYHLIVSTPTAVGCV